MNKILKNSIIALLLGLLSIQTTTASNSIDNENINTNEEVEGNEENELDIESINEASYLKAVISSDEAVKTKQSTIFDASQSFIPNPNSQIIYEWDFGDGNRNEGIEVLHAYQEPGEYTVTLKITDGNNSSKTSQKVFAYRKLVFLITDQTSAEERIELIKEFAKTQGVFISIIESFGSSTEFISEEILTKKLTENEKNLLKAGQILIWTKENAGLNALSRFIQNNQESPINFSQKSIIVLDKNVQSNISRIQKQLGLIKPKTLIVTQEVGINLVIESKDDEELTQTLQDGGYIHEIIDESTGQLKPWNFMSYFVNILINTGIPDNTIALILLLPVIATVVAIMRQVVGVTTFGIYTPSLLTLSFLIIGLYAGLLTLLMAIIAGALLRPLLKKTRMLFIPKMAIVITIISMAILLLLIISNSLNLFDAQFLSIAVFPMIVISTSVEKMISVKSEKGLISSIFLMSGTVVVAVTAYIIAGGEINLGFTTMQFSSLKTTMLTYPEIIILLLIVNLGLAKWSGLRLMEYVRFREILRHIEE